MRFFYNTSKYLNDTDGDGILDGQEISNMTDPRNNDTDGDGLSDLFEIMNGTDPTNRDTDGNGLNDSEDPYTFSSNVEMIWASYDEDEDTLELIENLEKYTNVTVFQPEDIGNYSDKENILIVGRPGTENSTAGNITMNILASVAPDALSEMQASVYDRFAVEYDVWSENQTMVMLSHPYPSDHYKVLELFKTSSDLEYLSAVSLFKADSIDKMGLYVMVELKDPVKPSVELAQYDEDELPHNLSFGLSSGDLGVKYVDINVSENVMNGTVNNIERALIVLYYTGRDLDRTGDLDGNDVGDIDESTLSMVWYNETSGMWEKMSTDMDWVNGLGISTDNDVIGGREYEGYMWANVTHFSTYGLSGGERTEVVVSPDSNSDDDGPLDSDRDGLFDFVERRMGTDPYNQDTDDDGIIDSKDEYPLGYVSDDEASDIVTCEGSAEQADTPTDSVGDESVPDDDGTSSLFWMPVIAIVALLAGIVVLRRK